MEVLPAIDLLGGKVVRLAQGDYAASTTYSQDPPAVAKDFAASGVRWIHVVDLDAARSGQQQNTDVVQRICQAVCGADIKVQCGGGVRDRIALQSLQQAGVSRCVIGSAAMKNWSWFEKLLADEAIDNRSLALGLDARDGCLAAEGWQEQLPQTALELARGVTGSGLGAIIYTDIARDGMLTGVNLQATRELISATDVPIIASGGVSSLEDVRQCRHIGCTGVIVGKAYYEGRIDLAQAVRLGQELSSSEG